MLCVCVCGLDGVVVVLRLFRTGINGKCADTLSTD